MQRKLFRRCSLTRSRPQQRMSHAPAKKQSTDRFADWEDDALFASAQIKSVDDEMAEYLSSRLSDNPDPDSVLQWWKFNKERFSALSKLARFIFCIPASSAPSERAFSVCGRILEERRTELGPQSFSNILFLHSNMMAKWLICSIHSFHSLPLFILCYFSVLFEPLTAYFCCYLLIKLGVLYIKRRDDAAVLLNKNCCFSCLLYWIFCKAVCLYVPCAGAKSLIKLSYIWIY